MAEQLEASVDATTNVDRNVDNDDGDDDDDDDDNTTTSSSSSSESDNGAIDAEQSRAVPSKEKESSTEADAVDTLRRVFWTSLARTLLRFHYAPLANAIAWRLDPQTRNNELTLRAAAACAEETTKGKTLREQLRGDHRSVAARQRAMSQSDNVTEEARRAERSNSATNIELEEVSLFSFHLFVWYKINVFLSF